MRFSIFRGNPSGSQDFNGSLESASENSPWFLRERNCSSPHGVMGGTSLSLALDGPAQKPTRSRFGAGPPPPFLDSWSTMVFPVSARADWPAWRVCDHPDGKKA